MSALHEAQKAFASSDLADEHGRSFAAERELKRAQVLATIAVAEEQRTANLIALFDEEGPEVFREVRSDDPEERKRGVERIRSRWLVLAAEIAERLDLS